MRVFPFFLFPLSKKTFSHNLSSASNTGSPGKLSHFSSFSFPGEFRFCDPKSLNRRRFLFSPPPSSTRSAWMMHPLCPPILRRFFSLLAKNPSPEPFPLSLLCGAWDELPGRVHFFFFFFLFFSLFLLSPWLVLEEGNSPFFPFSFSPSHRRRGFDIPGRRAFSFSPFFSPPFFLHHSSWLGTELDPFFFSLIRPERTNPPIFPFFSFSHEAVLFTGDTWSSGPPLLSPPS